jgi:hypothetical protein
MSRDAGKGDAYRPVNQKKWDENYDRMFPSKKPKASDDSSPPSRVSPVDATAESR